MEQLEPHLLGSMSAAAVAACLICSGLLVSSVAVAQQAAPSQPPTRYYWYDGDVRRPLYLDETQRATFGDRKATRDAVLGPAGARAGVQSPVFRDAPGGQERALPGGVIVTLEPGLSTPRARALLVDDGLTPVRQLGEGSPMWLVQSAPGLASLALANRLHESGRYRSVSPNWWQPRRLK